MVPNFVEILSLLTKENMEIQKYVYPDKVLLTSVAPVEISQTRYFRVKLWITA